MHTNKNLKFGLLLGFMIVLIGLVVVGWRSNWRFGISSRVLQLDYWPTDGWKTSTPEEQGLDSAKLAEGLSAIRAKNIQVHSLLIIRHGYSVLEATFYPYDGQVVHDIASDTKSVMTTLIGIAIDRENCASTIRWSRSFRITPLPTSTSAKPPSLSATSPACLPVLTVLLKNMKRH